MVHVCNVLMSIIACTAFVLNAMGRHACYHVDCMQESAGQCMTLTGAFPQCGAVPCVQHFAYLRMRGVSG